MEPTLILGLVVGIAGLLAFFGKATEAAGKPPAVRGGLDAIYQYHAKRNGLDWRLLKAIAQVESSENPNDVNPADPSFGLMQILCKPDGNGGCRNKFYIDGWPPKNKEALFDPNYNVHLGAQILAWNIERYGFERGIAVYNSWGARNDDRNGPFRNQAYVTKVLRNYNALLGPNRATG